jgi:exodeoxyribonuclease III
MKIITWNVNGIRAAAKKGFAQFVTQEDPDLLCVQETKAHPDQVETSLLESIGRTGHWSSAERAGYSGTATFFKPNSPFKPQSTEHGIGIPKFDSEGRFVVTQHKDFKLYNVYFPNGGGGPERHAYKQEFLKKFTRHLKRDLEDGNEVILVGDYNVAHEEVDVYDPVALAKESGFLPEERQWFGEFLSLGFIDAFRMCNPAALNHYTWWSYKDFGRAANRGWRIDYTCVSSGLRSRVKSCDVLMTVDGSDHCPVRLELMA